MLSVVNKDGDHDPLGEALHFLRMSGVSYCRSEFTAPWGLSLPLAEGCARFHLVVSGTAILREGDQIQKLETGDFALVPHGHGHALLDDSTSPVAQLEDLKPEHQNERYAVFRHGGGGPATQVVCVKVRFEHPAAHQLIAQLPKIIHVQSANAHEMKWLDSILRFIGSEARTLRPGGDVVLTRLADILIIQTIRWWIEHQPAMQPGWLAGLRDTRIGRAITLVHREPARPWTVAALATEVAMSRSSFANRFTQLVGEPVMRYVARWRMYTALSMLRQEDADIGELSTRLGYASEAAFNRNFKRLIGITPGAARRRPPESQA
jgi:AraC-like DNA-binding protein/mannose-6-phosphate isomerase-like protein (cupin superfamily)